jgi:hypothetical protein
LKAVFVSPGRLRRAQALQIDCPIWRRIKQKFKKGSAEDETDGISVNRIGARGEIQLHIVMFHHRLLLRPFACLRLAACAVLLSCALLTLAPPTASAQVEEMEEVAPAWDLSKPCENAQHPYQSELCQQWRVAEAAEQTAAAAGRTTTLTRLLMLMGAVIVGLLLLAFIPLIAGALAARKAARNAGVMPEFVMPENTASRDDEEEVRAYLDVDEVEFIETPESEGIVKVKVAFKNTGQTPAFKTRSATEVCIRDETDEDLVPVMPLPSRSGVSARPRLGRDATAVDIVECESTPNLSDRVMNGDASIVVWGWVEYVDVFDRWQKTAFQYLCTAETLGTGQVFKPTIRGDEDD